MWPDGLVALTHAFRLVALLSFAHPRIVTLALTLALTLTLTLTLALTLALTLTLTLTLTSSPSTAPTLNLLTLASPDPDLLALASSPSA